MSAKYTFLAWDTPIENAPLKLALLQLANNADDDGFSYYSISKMAVSCGMSEKTFQRKIATMEKMGILTVGRRANRTSLYTLVGDEMGVSLCRLQESEATESPLGATESRLVSDRESHDLNSNPVTKPESITQVSKNSDKEERNEVLEGSFEHWWKFYPGERRSDKPGCFAKWKTKCKKLSLDEIESLANEVAIDVSDRIIKCEDLNYFPRTPAYLTKERWKDGQ